MKQVPAIKATISSFRVGDRAVHQGHEVEIVDIRPPGIEIEELREDDDPRDAKAIYTTTCPAWQSEPAWMGGDGTRWATDDDLTVLPCFDEYVRWGGVL